MSARLAARQTSEETAILRTTRMISSVPNRQSFQSTRPRGRSGLSLFLKTVLIEVKRHSPAIATSSRRFQSRRPVLPWRNSRL